MGASYVDHMNDDAPEVDSFSRECYQALSSPHFLRREPGDEATDKAVVVCLSLRLQIGTERLSTII